jgi:colanic acid biosynthesis glycosyl transferase WcaI
VRVLLTSMYYWPEVSGNAPYVTRVAESLALQGHDVRVISGFPHYPAWSRARGIIARETRNGVVVSRRAHFVPRRQSAAQRAIYELSLFAGSLTSIAQKRPDVVVGVSPTLSGAALAAVASGFYRRPYGLIFQDLMGKGAMQSGVHGGDRIAGLVGATELALARRAALIGVIAEGFSSHFKGGGVPAERIVRLRNWSTDLDGVSDREMARRDFGWSESDLLCVHAGNMGQKQGLDNLLRAAEQLPAVKVILAGDGNDRTRLMESAVRRQLTNVAFLPVQSSATFRGLLAAADVLLVNQRGGVGDMSLASKLTSYFAASRPVIAAVDHGSETAKELIEARAGLVVRPDDPTALAAAIRELIEQPDRRFELGRNGRLFAEQTLSPEVVLKQYSNFVERLKELT